MQSRDGEVSEYDGRPPSLSIARVIDGCEEVSRSVAVEVARDGEAMVDGVLVYEDKRFRGVGIGLA